MVGKNPSPEYAAGLLTALDRTCPVCKAAPKVTCTTALMVRSAAGPRPLILDGPHFDRVLSL